MVVQLRNMKTKILVEVRNLTKNFKGAKAVDGISFDIHEGEIVGLLGPNGAGKTTTIRMMLSLIIPDSGEIHILGKDLSFNREEILKQVNFTFVNNTFGGRLTVKETLNFFAKLYEVNEADKIIKDLLEKFEISNLKDKKTRELSSGELSRIALCKAMINKPKILFLDEPTASLDPDIADKTRILIKDIKRQYGMTILYTSHNMHEVEEMCDRIIFLHKGKIIISGTPLEITREIIHESAKEPAMRDVFIKISRGDLDES